MFSINRGITPLEEAILLFTLLYRAILDSLNRIDLTIIIIILILLLYKVFGRIWL